MKLLKISIRNNCSGFTMIEVLVSMGLLSILVSLGLFLSMDVWRTSSFRSEQDTIISLLYKARSRAVANINESDHGLYIDVDNRKYVLYEGSYVEGDPENQEFQMGKGVSLSGSANILFAAREATTDGEDVVIDGEGKEATINVNEEGGVTW